MAILRSLDGQFYEVPDDQLSKFLIPADKVKEKVQAGGGEDPGPPPGNDPGPPPGGGTPAIVVQIYGAGTPPGGPPPTGTETPAAAGGVQPYAWWNTWRNTYHPGWHNVWHNVRP
jgi:hypothetical protein